ncbi:hypothetical protein F4801DRAFT_583500 [Xylaria longipes]|nr:hypothetical protein F4801DRAFT_583500 [Xylaria longipes]
MRAKNKIWRLCDDGVDVTDNTFNNDDSCDCYDSSEDSSTQASDYDDSDNNDNNYDNSYNGNYHKLMSDPHAGKTNDSGCYTDMVGIGGGSHNMPISSSDERGSNCGVLQHETQYFINRWGLDEIYKHYVNLVAYSNYNSRNGLDTLFAIIDGSHINPVSYGWTGASGIRRLDTIHNGNRNLIYDPYASMNSRSGDDMGTVYTTGAGRGVYTCAGSKRIKLTHENDGMATLASLHNSACGPSLYSSITNESTGKLRSTGTNTETFYEPDYGSSFDNYYYGWAPAH